MTTSAAYTFDLSNFSELSPDKANIEFSYSDKIEKFNSTKLTLVSDATKATYPTKSNVQSSFILGLVLASLQVADGALTTIGVTKLGIENEGNPLVRGLMNLMGHIPAILLVKLAAIFVVFGLCKLASEILWIRPALKVMIAIYFFAAVIPWSYILITG